MNNKNNVSIDEFFVKLCEYTKEDYESDLMLANRFEKMKINKPLVDFLKWKTSQYMIVNNEIIPVK